MSSWVDRVQFIMTDKECFELLEGLFCRVLLLATRVSTDNLLRTVCNVPRYDDESSCVGWMECVFIGVSLRLLLTCCTEFIGSFFFSQFYLVCNERVFVT